MTSLAYRSGSVTGHFGCDVMLAIRGVLILGLRHGLSARTFFMATRHGLNGEYRDGLGESGGISDYKATNWLKDNAALTVSGSLWSPIFVFIFIRCVPCLLRVCPQ